MTEVAKNSPMPMGLGKCRAEGDAPSVETWTPVVVAAQIFSSPVSLSTAVTA
ncbi:hypothetical protein NHF46_00585 [Arthrobacter alpinus]|nr:hypothetical protein [Arthrobacter alpinus]